MIEGGRTLSAPNPLPAPTPSGPRRASSGSCSPRAQRCALAREPKTAVVHRPRSVALHNCTSCVGTFVDRVVLKQHRFSPGATSRTATPTKLCSCDCTFNVDDQSIQRMLGQEVLRVSLCPQVFASI